MFWFQNSYTDCPSLICSKIQIKIISVWICPKTIPRLSEFALVQNPDWDCPSLISSKIQNKIISVWICPKSIPRLSEFASVQNPDPRFSVRVWFEPEWQTDCLSLFCSRIQTQIARVWLVPESVPRLSQFAAAALVQNPDRGWSGQSRRSRQQTGRPCQWCLMTAQGNDPLHCRCPVRRLQSLLCTPSMRSWWCVWLCMYVKHPQS